MNGTSHWAESEAAELVSMPISSALKPPRAGPKPSCAQAVCAGLPTPVPVRVARTPPFVANSSVPERVPVACGVNATWTTQLANGWSEAPLHWSDTIRKSA